MVAILAAACTESSDGPTTRVFAKVPWTGNEDITYRILEGGKYEYGTCVFETRPEFEAGKTRVSHLCGDGPHRDDGWTIAESATLRPIQSERVISDSEEGKRTSFAGTYEPGVVRLKVDDNGKLRETTRELPKPDADSPEPGWYDDESLLWVIRGIPLEKGWQGAFKSVNIGNAQVVHVELEVEELEKVSVPAGEFMAWKVRISTSSITQLAWVDSEAPHLMVKRRIEQLTYELVEVR